MRSLFQSLNTKSGLIGVFAAATLMNMVLFSPMFSGWTTNLGHSDADYHFFLLEAVRKSIFEYMQIPFWDPWHMGGMPLLGNPQAPISPLYLTAAVFGTVAGLKLTIFILSIAGYIGTYHLVRELGGRGGASHLGAAIWTLSAMHPWQLEGGWLFFFHLHLIPLSVLAFIRWHGDRRYSVPFGMVLSLVYFGGSPYPAVMLITFLIPLSIGISLERGSWRPFTFLIMSGLVMFCVSAVKLLPTVEWLIQKPRDMEGYKDGYNIAALWHSMIGTDIGLGFQTPLMFGDERTEGQIYYLSNEYGIYLGPIVLFLAVAGLLTANIRYRWSLISLFVFFAVLTMGDNSAIPLWALMKKLPVYGTMRVVTRFRWLLLLLVSIFAAFGLENISSRLGRKTLIEYSFLVAVILNMGAVSLPVYKRVFDIDGERIRLDINPEKQFYQIHNAGSYETEGWVKGKNLYGFSFPAMYPYIVENVGVVQGYEPFGMKIFARGKGVSDYVGEAFIWDGNRSIPVTVKRWSPNRVEIEWSGAESGKLYLNQNYYPGWRVCGGGVDISSHTLIGARIKEGISSAGFCYYPVWGISGFVLSSISILVSLLYCAKLRHGGGVC